MSPGIVFTGSGQIPGCISGISTGSNRIPGCVSGNKCLPAVAGFRDVSPELSPERSKEMWVMYFVNDQLKWMCVELDLALMLVMLPTARLAEHLVVA